MLVLTRKIGEGFHITAPNGDVIEIVLKTCNRGRAQIGVGAPESYKIRRIAPEERLPRDDDEYHNRARH